MVHFFSEEQTSAQSSLTQDQEQESPLIVISTGELTYTVIASVSLSVQSEAGLSVPKSRSVSGLLSGPHDWARSRWAPNRIRKTGPLKRNERC